MKTERPKECVMKRGRYWDSKIASSDIASSRMLHNGSVLQILGYLTSPTQNCETMCFLCLSHLDCASVPQQPVSIHSQHSTTKENHKAFLKLCLGLIFGNSWKSVCLHFLLPVIFIIGNENVMIKYTFFPYPKQHTWRSDAFFYSIS